MILQVRAGQEETTVRSMYTLMQRLYLLASAIYYRRQRGAGSEVLASSIGGNSLRGRRDYLR